MELASAALVSPVCVVSPGELLSSNVAEEDIARVIRLITCKSVGIQKWPGGTSCKALPTTAHQHRAVAQVTTA